MMNANAYFLVSFLIALASILYVLNLVIFRQTGKLLLGSKLKTGTPEYKKMEKIVSSRRIAFSVVASLLLVLNLAVGAFGVIRSYPTSWNYFLVTDIIEGAVSSAALVAIVTYMQKHQA